MTDKELRKLRREDLLQILLDQRLQVEELEEKLAAANEALQSREITIQESGNIAEAALKLNNVFADAQAAADQFCEQAMNQAEALRKRAEEELENAKKTASEIVSRARVEADEIRAQAAREASRPAVTQTAEPESAPEEKKRGFLSRRGR